MFSLPITCHVQVIYVCFGGIRERSSITIMKIDMGSQGNLGDLADGSSCYEFFKKKGDKRIASLLIAVKSRRTAHQRLPLYQNTPVP